MSGYHFCRDCMHYPDSEEEIVKRGKKELILHKCPIGGSGLYYKGDFYAIQWSCVGFEEGQIRLEV